MASSKTTSSKTTSSKTASSKTTSSKTASKKPTRRIVKKQEVPEAEVETAQAPVSVVSVVSVAEGEEGSSLTHWSESSFIQKLIEAGKKQQSLDSEEIGLALHRANESLPEGMAEGTFDDLMKLLESKGIEIADLADDEMLMEEDIDFDDIEGDFMLADMEDGDILDHEELEARAEMMADPRLSTNDPVRQYLHEIGAPPS
ncbi:MAG: RNA polymerase sigma factor region1.1 domain-containing protein [Deinococcales bacterium]